MAEEKTKTNQSRYLKYAKIRDEKGFSDAQVAREAGITQSTLSDWKNGSYTPAFGNIVAIAEILGVSANEFEVSEEQEL